jgi:hypothetical protein
MCPISVPFELGLTPFKPQLTINVCMRPQIEILRPQIFGGNAMNPIRDLGESAQGLALRGFAKLIAVIIILSVAVFGDVMYVIEMQKVFQGQGLLIVFCYLGAMTSVMAIGYLLLGKSSVFSPGGQMLASWIAFGVELVVIALNVMIVFTHDKIGFLGMWAYLSPATPVMHMLLVAVVYFLDPHHKMEQLKKELKNKEDRAEIEYQHQLGMARVAVKAKQLQFVVREMEAAVNSPESQQRIAQHATSVNDMLLTEMSGSNRPKEDDNDDDGDYYNTRRFGRK